jgi:hypothetical protein
MKKTILLFLLSVSIYTQAQVAINPTGAAPHPSAILDVNSSSKGLLLPRTTDPTANIATPAAGLMTYNTSTNTPNYYNGQSWQNVNGTQSISNIGFGNSETFFASMQVPGQTLSWTVPAGITRIMIEAWGGGGGGELISYLKQYANQYEIYGVGGGAGGFASRMTSVTPGQVIKIIVGKGGVGGFLTTPGSSVSYTAETAGTYSYVYTEAANNQPQLNYAIAYGGDAGKDGGSGGYFYFTRGINGENGEPPLFASGREQPNSSTQVSYPYTWYTIKMGNGGSAYMGGAGGKASAYHTGGTSTYQEKVYNDHSVAKTLYAFKTGGIPGGGGGADWDKSGSGGDGLVIIHY